MSGHSGTGPARRREISPQDLSYALDGDHPQQCVFPVQPPRGSVTDPGPCRCGRTYAQDQADRMLALAGLAVHDAYPSGTTPGRSVTDRIITCAAASASGAGERPAVAAAPVLATCDRPRDGVPCGGQAPFRVARGTRRHDAENACPDHLHATVVALAQGGGPVTVEVRYG